MMVSDGGNGNDRMVVVLVMVAVMIGGVLVIRVIE